jgi:hypothetical protein
LQAVHILAQLQLLKFVKQNNHSKKQFRPSS